MPDYQHSADLCMVVVKGKYAPEDLGALADRLDGDSLKGLHAWINSLGENKPVTLLHVINMITRIAKGNDHDPEFIKRMVIAECRKYPEFIAKVEAFDKENGEGAYLKAGIKSIKAKLASIKPEQFT